MVIDKQEESAKMNTCKYREKSVLHGGAEKEMKVFIQ